MSTEVELEKTYLAAFIPREILGLSPVFIEDTYIPEDDDFSILRLRRRGTEFEITKKEPVLNGDFSQHKEHTIVLNKQEYDALYLSSQKRVIKNRYKTIINAKYAEVDIFVGNMQGLVLIDFEFKNLKDMQEFHPPDCCLKDVTQCREILGGQLAGKSYSDIEGWLSSQGYKRLS